MVIHALITCRSDYCNSLLYNVPMHKTDRLKTRQNQCAQNHRVENTLPRLKIHWFKIQDSITYKIIRLTYISNALISRKESSMNTRLGPDHHQPIMPPISKDFS